MSASSDALGVPQAVGGPELAHAERALPVLAVAARRARADLHQAAVATEQLVGVVRPRREAVLDAEALLEEIGVRVGLDDAPAILPRAGERGGDGPRRRVVAAEHDRRDARVDREDEIERALRDRERRDRQSRRRSAGATPGIERRAASPPSAPRRACRRGAAAARRRRRRCRRHRARRCVPASRELLEEPRANRLRAEVRAATKASADVGRDPEHEGARAPEPSERGAKALVDLRVGPGSVEPSLQARAARRGPSIRDRARRRQA